MNIKQIITIGVAGMAMGALALDKVEVTGVTARQRYPWNGLVDIDFTTDSNPTEPYQMKVVAFDNVGKTNLPVKTCYTDGVSFKENPCMVRTDTRRILWDAAADLPNGFKATNVLVSCQDVRANPATNTYMVVDLSGGTSAEHFPISYMSAPPSGGWTEEYMTEKLVLRRVDPGTYYRDGGERYQSGAVIYQKVTITKPFYMAVFELTAKQYSLIYGGEGSDTSPMKIPWNVIRGYELTNVASASVAMGSQYVGYTGGGYSYQSVNYTVTQSSALQYSVSDTSVVDSSSIVGRLRVKTGLSFDIPSEGQWEYACRAGSSTELNIGLGNSTQNAALISGASKLDPTGTHYIHVGNYMPNSIGLYDMCGSVGEWCLDVYTNMLGSAETTDPYNAMYANTGVTIYDGIVRGSTTYNSGGPWGDSSTTYNYDIEGAKQTVKGQHFLRIKYTAEGVAHVVRGGNALSGNRFSSGLNVNNSGTFFTTGYYGAKGYYNSNPSYQVRLVVGLE